VMVNDSDAWCYTLHRGDRQLDEFESGEGGDDEEEMLPGNLEDMTAALGSLQKMMTDGSLMERMAELQQHVQSEMPPDMEAIQARVQAGQASRQEMEQFKEWFATNNRDVAQQLEDMIGQILPGSFMARTRKKSAAKKAKQPSAKIDAPTRERIEKLRPLFADDTSDEEVQEVFAAHATFAEETLADFLPLLDIPGYYAYLSYGYLEESTPEELDVHSIRFIHHLRFASPDS